MTDTGRALADRTLVVSGASRGIGLAIGQAAARQGADIVLLAKTAEPHPKLKGTVFTAAEEIEAAGGKAAAVVGDVRKEGDVERVIETAVQRFGGSTSASTTPAPSPPSPPRSSAPRSST